MAIMAKMSEQLGKIVRIEISELGLDIDVTVLDAKHSYGNLRYLVSPISGNGEIWINASRVKLEECGENNATK
jgi:hypothetical protein